MSHQPCVSHYGWAGPAAAGRELLALACQAPFPGKGSARFQPLQPPPPRFPLGPPSGAPACLSNSERRSFSLSRMATCSRPHSFSTSSGW